MAEMKRGEEDEGDREDRKADYVVTWDKDEFFVIQGVKLERKTMHYPQLPQIIIESKLPSAKSTILATVQIKFGQGDSGNKDSTFVLFWIQTQYYCYGLNSNLESKMFADLGLRGCTRAREVG
ncbi:unnamed protein product [Vicia faba]|uniref:Uncharacterized protein n=1 Tax=Vicia faba TaxID=3906 RepID=A0AAV0ZMX2_VICFA|nr:unnamed protein product [Vicia faba]